MSLILFGHKGVGKTTVGAQLAQRLQWSHIDTDQALLAYYRACVGDAASVRTIYQTEGAVAFRALEERVVASLTIEPQCVVSVGGSTLLSERNVQHMTAYGQRVYMRMTLADYLTRLGSMRELPDFLATRAQQVAYYAQRDGEYQRIADKVVKVVPGDFDLDVLIALLA